MFSFTVQMEDGRTVPLLQYVVSLAITEAVKDVCDQNVSWLLSLFCCYLLKNNTKINLANWFIFSL